PDRGLTIAPPVLKLDHGFALPGNLTANLIGRRPDVMAARLRAESAANRIRQRRAEFYPDLNLSAFMGFQSLGLDLLTRNGSQIASIGPAFSLPIFSGGRLKGQLQGARAEFAESVAAYDATLAHAIQEVADHAVSLKALGPRLAKAQEAVTAASEAHQVALNRYQGGLANFLEVLSAEEALLDSLNAQTDLCTLSFSLDVGLQRALGGGYQASAR
ncbi:MAG TPA: TolC family protein, partial [Holophaga sp.]|nr:TolC family protein [Holophaga sp.]